MQSETEISSMKTKSTWKEIVFEFQSLLISKLEWVHQYRINHLQELVQQSSLQ